jgi:hypothetical protein
MEQSKSGSFVKAIGVCSAEGSRILRGAGNTKTTEETKARSGSWQQDMEQVVMPNVS